MRKFIIGFFPLLLCALISMSFVACGDDDDDEEEYSSENDNIDPEKALIGTWEYSDSNKEETFTFKSDYTGTNYMYYKSSKVTNKAAITWKMYGYPYTIKYEGLNKWSGSGESGEDWIEGTLTFDGKNLYDGKTKYTKR